MSGEAPTDRKVAGRSKEDVLFPVPDTRNHLPDNYGSFFSAVKEIVARERIKAVMSANAAMVLMYWDIGQAILMRQRDEGWGTRVIDRLAHDLRTAFPEMTGLSPRNLKYMRRFAEAWPDRTIVQRTVALLPWRSKPIGVAQWERQITQSLPDNLKPSLPSVEDIEAEITKNMEVQP